jgi:hypothetical protein
MGIVSEGPDAAGKTFLIREDRAVAGAVVCPAIINAEILVRSEKSCVSGGESPSSLEARLPEFGTKVMNGKV